MQVGDLRRNCARGLGCPLHADAFWSEAHTQQHPFVCQEVVCATEAIIVGTLWLLREIELASLTVGDVQVVDGAGCGVATIQIAASKQPKFKAGAPLKASVNS